MLDRGLWETITKEYEIAKKYLGCPRYYPDWHRDEEIGMPHLLWAGRLAREAEEKDELLYAKILMALDHEMQDVKSCRERLELYLKPAYEILSRREEKPGDEWRWVRKNYEKLTCEAEETSGTDAQYKRAFSRIEKIGAAKGFPFNDCGVCGFSHGDDKKASLTLGHDWNRVNLEFSDVREVEIRSHYLNDNWIKNLCCYPEYDGSDLVFEAGYYKIICGSVKVTDSYNFLDRLLE